MKKRFDISGWKLDVDIQATAAAYAQPRELCNCAYCRNFLSALSFLPKELTIFLGSLGADSSSPVYISEFCRNQDGTHLYGAFYDLIGEIVSGPGYEKGATFKLYPLAPANIPLGVKLCLSGEAYAPGHFPDPAIELEFFLNVPWVLSELSNNV